MRLKVCCTSSKNPLFLWILYSWAGTLSNRDVVIGRCLCIGQVRISARFNKWLGTGVDLILLMLNSAVRSQCEERHWLKCRGFKSWMRVEEKGVTWNKELSGTNGRVVGTDFWQDKALGIFWCPDSSDAAMNMTQGHRGSLDSPVSKLFNTWLCNQGMLLLHVVCYC